MPKASSQWSGTPSIRGSSEPARMVLLTFGLVGVVFCWALEATYCTPYLLSLGLSKSNTSLVFIAGPLSGLLMQPVVGAITDRSTSRHGRRRPLIFSASIVTGFCLLLLGWTKEAVGLFVADEARVKSAAMVVAVLNIYAIDFAINAVQACLRSLIVDVLPIAQQQSGSAWATRVGGFGSLASYGVGSLDLVSLLPMLPGDTQFKKMTVVSVSMLWLSTGITCYSVTERVLISSPDHNKSILGILPTIWERTFNLPPRIRGICWAQFWSWIGWFPFFFYGSTWVGETYYRYEHKPDPTDNQHDALGNIGRLGSVALVMHSIVSFTGSVFFPYLIRATVDKPKMEDQYTPRLPPSLPSSIQKIVLTIARLPKPRLVTAWQWAHLSFAFVMIWSPLVRSLVAANLVIALCGIPGAIGGWAPFAELGIEINRLATGNPSYSSVGSESAMIASGGFRGVQSRDDDMDDDFELSNLEAVRPRSTSFLRLSHPESEVEESSTGELAGVYLGVLNVYTTLPQFIGTFISWVVFQIFEPDRSSVKDNDPEHHRWLDTKGINGISVCFFIGAVCAVIASEATRRLKKIS